MKYLVLILLLFSYNCQADYWTRKADFPNGWRMDAYGFTIGGKAYVGGGYNSNSSDLWEYDPIADNWARKADLPTGFKRLTSSFSIGNYGYVCCGTDTGGNFSNLLFEYNSLNDSWTQKANLPGLPRSGAAAFVVGNIAYVGIGANYTNCFNDFYAYNQITNTWAAIPSVPVLGYGEGFAFSINNSGYILGLGNCSGLISDTIWSFNTISNMWITKAPFPDTPRSDAAALSINGYGYFGTGDCAGCRASLFNDWWLYNPYLNSWTQKSRMPTTERDETTSFTINNKGYVCFGGESHDPQLWEYTPDSLLGTNYIASNNQLMVYPNPFTSQLIIQSSTPNTSFKITDINGKLICYGTTVGNNERINTTTWPQGNYFIELLYWDGSRELRKVVK